MLDIFRALKNMLQQAPHSMPSHYHEHCMKPGPKSSSYMPPKHLRIFKSKSAPTSPMCGKRTDPLSQERIELREKSTTPRLARSVTFVEKRTKQVKEEKVKPPRSKSFGKADQKLSLGRLWHPGCLRCGVCAKRLQPGQHSEYHGIPYCNIPCYSSLPNGTEDGPGTVSKLTPDQETLRMELMPKLKDYNTYYENNKSCQLTSREVNGKLVLEGVLKVYWGLKKPVTLASQTTANYRKDKVPLHPPEENQKGEDTSSENGVSAGAPYSSQNSPLHRRPSRRRSMGYSEKRSGSKAYLKRRQSFADPDPRVQAQSTTFIPPHGTPTNLRLTNQIHTKDVVSMLFSKFQISDNPKRYGLYIIHDNGETRHLKADESPLTIRLLLGPSEDVAKIFIMEEKGTQNVPHEVAQYLHFAMPVLEAFLEKFREEEEREIEKIKERYQQYRDVLQLKLQGISTAV